MLDDIELLRQYAEQASQEAFAELVRRRIDLVYSIALRRLNGDGQSAEDVVQVVFRDLAGKAPKLCQHPMLIGWLFRSTRYAANRARRTTCRRRDREQEAFERRTAGPSEQELHWCHLSPIVDHLLERLGERDRSAILLRYYEGQSYAEIGRVIASTEDGARMCVQRALEKLRALLEKQGIRSTTVALAALLDDHAVAAAPVGLASHVVAASAVALSATMPTALISLMSTLKVTGVLAALAMLGAVGVIEWHEQSKLTAEYHELGVEREKLAEQERTTSRVSDASPHGRPASETGAVRALPKTPLADTKAQTEKDKELLRRYGPFFKVRGLSAEQISRFIALLNQMAENRADLQEATRKEGLPDGPAIEAMRNDLNRPIVEGLRQLLGDDGYSAYGAFERTSYYQSAWVQPLEGFFSGSNIPIDDAQTVRLTQIIEANDHPIKIVATDLGNESAIDWDTVVAQGASILTPAQLAVLQTQVQQLKIQQDQNIARHKVERGLTSTTP
jgi:RNA polymerase sigma factor (sigma-70 family)